MGKVGRERKERILAGLEKPISEETRGKARRTGLKKLQSQSTPKQVDFLADTLHSGHLGAGKLKRQLVKNAPNEMKKGIVRLRREGKTPTVDLLLEEYRKDKGFQKLANEVGLDSTWFENLAEEMIKDNDSLIAKQRQDRLLAQIDMVDKVRDKFMKARAEREKNDSNTN